MEITSDTPEQGIGLKEAASRFESILTAEEAGNQVTETPTPQPTKAAEATEEVAEASAAPEELEETPPDEEGDASDEEATAENEEQADDASLMDKPFTVKIDGKEEQVTLKEALAGYQRTADYTRKSMALAEEKKSFQGEREAITLERQQYSQLLPVLVEQIKGSMAREPNWAELLDSNPAEYVRQKELWREQHERLAAAQAEQQRLADLEAQERHNYVVSLVRTNAAELVKAMPQWRDPQRWSADRERLLSYGEQLGFSKDEIQQTYDHRAVLALYKAMKYDELVAKRPKPVVQSGPKPVRPGAAASPQSRKVSDITRAKQRLAKTGRVRDAATLFEALL